MSNVNNKPCLQPPGKGLPILEMLMFQYIMLPLTSFGFSQQKAALKFDKETEKILAILNDVKKEDLFKPILIPRITGIEDSSRSWSIAQTLEHLNIVNTGIGHIIQQLQKGAVPDLKVEIKNVKPPKDTPEDIVQSFKTTSIKYIENIKTLGNLKSSESKHTHPWFGKLNSHQWFILTAFHNQIHRKQIEKIIAISSS